MEDTEEFEIRLFKLLLDAKRELNIKESTIVYILLREGINYYLKEIARGELC